jgi:hypothetical protein
MGHTWGTNGANMGDPWERLEALPEPVKQAQLTVKPEQVHGAAPGATASASP